ncbi:exonuclease RecJ [Bernardetia litoralis DSM 6794]|uniref:Single-stranded-DNA-specific exonuclease RecJ n=1 Tax=Bernardetia litoralis (strain ATCC 23117 / DSM 6794 / NBRC 15988 / NCIMB 1366 / Fx l1 / Sio-4) TaxID=880071 RepID=I4AIE1_BERLS|nr:single-stranded-DNA-specific exonuclease RecJ [Bernardetia litoralis]AFM03726.1 exonuclease RecJ [Bernardetia litoralis DSM 6794]
MQSKRWLFESLPSNDKISLLSKEINVSHVPATLLLQRGVSDFESAKAFFRPSLSHLHSPFLMKGMDIAINRLKSALENKEKILVYGDYDVDGVTSVAIIYGFLKKLYANNTDEKNVQFYIPNRNTEGYGITKEGLAFAKEENINLIICLDCGVKANEEIQQAKDWGIDFIVCDHHLPDDDLPVSFAMLNPKQKGCDYPFKDLSACAIGYKFLQGFCIRTGTSERNLHYYLDLVALSIAADLVPMKGENRILSYFGLEKINIDPLPGVKALLNLINGYGKKIGVREIVFSVAPRLNAAGRITDAYNSLNLLLASSESEANKLARELNQKNDLRREMEQKMMLEIDDILEKSNPERKTNVLFSKNWHKGLVGIAAAKCVEKTYRPTVILTHSESENGDLAVGSARSISDFDIYKAVESCSDLLTQFGGHKFASGMSMPIENVAQFQERFENAVTDTLEKEQLIPPVRVDMEINFSSITQKMFAVVKQMSPFGPQNMRPVFVARNVQLLSPKIIKETHLKVQVRQGTSLFSAISFGKASFFNQISAKARYDIAFLISENNFRDRSYLQLEIRDILKVE